MPVPLRYPVLMPDTPPDIVTEIGNSRTARRLKEELITGAQFQQEYVIYEQDRINEANRLLEFRRIEGLGELIARLSPGVYWQMIEDHGYACWGDPDFMEDTLRRNPGLRIRMNRPVRISFDFAGRDEECNKRAVEHRAGGRAPDPVTLVPGIEHSAACLSQTGSTAEAAGPRCAGGQGDGAP